MTCSYSEIHFLKSAPVNDHNTSACFASPPLTNLKNWLCFDSETIMIYMMLMLSVGYRNNRAEQKQDFGFRL